jgi:hypothetical protein
MKLDILLEKKIKAKFKDRKPLFYSRVKFFTGGYDGETWM